MDFSRIKNFAKNKVKENFGSALFLTLVAYVCIAGLSAIIPIVGALGGLLIAPPFALSLIHVYVAILAGRKPEFKEVFSGFSDWWSSVKVYFFQGLFSSLWSLLFVIPGIVKACAYSQAMYILSSHPGKSALECLRESEKLMKGHKMRFFFLHLSFIGWYLLCGITFGLALIWFVPYYNAAMATFYIDILPSKSEDSSSSAPAQQQQQQSSSSSAPRKTITFGNKGGKN